LNKAEIVKCRYGSTQRHKKEEERERRPAYGEEYGAGRASATGEEFLDVLSHISQQWLSH
jgi:hypothetical protein